MDCILTYSEQSLCAKPTGECSRFHHTLNREERRAESSYPVISLKCLWGGVTEGGREREKRVEAVTLKDVT